MHEMSYVIRFADMAMEAVESEPDAVIEKVVIEVGAMTGVLPEYLIKYYPEAVAKTRLEGSTLEVEMRPVAARCSVCKAEYEPSAGNDYSCPECGSKEASIIHGRELNLLRVEIAQAEHGSV